VDPSPRSRTVELLLLAGGTTYALSQTLIIPAIPALAERLDTDAAGASWLLTAFLVSASVATPLAGKLGDLHGRGRVLGAVMALFCVGSVLCATTTELGVAVVGRVLQGAAAGVFPLAYGVIRETFPGPRVMAAIGMLSVSLGIGSALGPALAGVIVERLGPAAIFWIGMAGAIPVLAAPWVIAERARPHRPRLDWLGAILLSGALTCLLFAITQGNRWHWTSVRTGALLAGACGLLVVWLWAERRPDPLIDLEQLRGRTVALTNVASLCLGAGVFAAYVPVAAYAQAPESTGYGFGLTVSQAGLLLLPHGVVIVLCGRTGGALCRRIGSRATLVAGAATNALAAGLLVVAHGSVWWLAVSLSVLGIGQALALAAAANLIVGAVPPGDVGIATGLTTVMRTIGMALASAVVGAILSASADEAVFASKGAFVAAFGLAWAACVAAVAAGLGVPRLAAGADSREPRPLRAVT
jgi:MFS family permease